MILDEEFAAGIKACMPTVLGYWSIGFAAGGIGSLAGYSILEITWLAGLLYAGSAQFIFYSLDSAGAGVIAIVLGVIFVNVRYLLMSSSLSVHFKDMTAQQKLIGGALLTDETFGVAAQRCAGFGKLPFNWLLGLNLTAYINWVFANIIGAIFARSLPVTLTEGLSFSLTAMFVGLLLLTYFASVNRTYELMAICVAAAVVFLSFHVIDPNLSVVLATVVGALSSAIYSYSKSKGSRKWI